MAFGGVLVASRSDWNVIVDLRVASLSAKAASSQWRVALELRRVTSNRRREGLWLNRATYTLFTLSKLAFRSNSDVT